jgi:hypothetical protein
VVTIISKSHKIDLVNKNNNWLQLHLVRVEILDCRAWAFGGSGAKERDFGRPHLPGLVRRMVVAHAAGRRVWEPPALKARFPLCFGSNGDGQNRHQKLNYNRSQDTPELAPNSKISHQSLMLKFK